MRASSRSPNARTAAPNARSGKTNGFATIAGRIDQQRNSPRIVNLRQFDDGAETDRLVRGL
jgi:hypothetical protein